MPQSDKVQITINVETRTAAEYRAADLPEGSVVASEKAAWIKRSTEPDESAWQGTDGRHFADWFVDGALRMGAQVLRVGNGQEG